MKNFEELLYDCKCDIIEYQKIQKQNKATGYSEVKIKEQIPCGISYEKISTISVVDVNANKKMLSTKLFISPDIIIKPGSKIVVTNSLEQIKEYKSSGEPAMYDTHQEIMLELFNGWS